MSTCRSCGARVVWVRTERGKRTPVDADEVAGGGLTELGADADGSVLVRATPGAGTRRSHFATCPWASQHRRR